MNLGLLAVLVMLRSTILMPVETNDFNNWRKLFSEDSHRKHILAGMVAVCGIGVHYGKYYQSKPISVADDKNFVQAAQNGDTETLKILLDSGVQINNCYNNHNALTIAVENNHIQTAQLLLDRGAKVNSFNEAGKAALHYAHDLNMVKLLLINGADVNLKNNYDNTPLHSVAFPGKHPTEQDRIPGELIRYGADLFIKNEEGNTPAHKIISAYGNFSRYTARYMQEFKMTRQEWMQNSTYAAQMFLYYAMSKASLSKILSVKNDQGKTPAQMIENNGNQDLVKFLKECKKEKPEAIKTLIDIGSADDFEAFKNAHTPNMPTSLRHRELTGQKFLTKSSHF